MDGRCAECHNDLNSRYSARKHQINLFRDNMYKLAIIY